MSEDAWTAYIRELELERRHYVPERKPPPKPTKQATGQRRLSAATKERLDR